MGFIGFNQGIPAVAYASSRAGIEQSGIRSSATVMCL